MEAADRWSTPRLAEFVAAVTGAPDEASATRRAVDWATEALEAEIGLVVEGSVALASVGFPRGDAPAQFVAEASAGDREVLDVRRCRHVSTGVDPSRHGVRGRHRRRPSRHRCVQSRGDRPAASRGPVADADAAPLPRAGRGAIDERQPPQTPGAARAALQHPAQHHAPGAAGRRAEHDHRQRPRPARRRDGDAAADRSAVAAGDADGGAGWLARGRRQVHPSHQRRRGRHRAGGRRGPPDHRGEPTRSSMPVPSSQVSES